MSQRSRVRVRKYGGSSLATTAQVLVRSGYRSGCRSRVAGSDRGRQIIPANQAGTFVSAPTAPSPTTPGGTRGGVRYGCEESPGQESGGHPRKGILNCPKGEKCAGGGSLLVVGETATI